MTISKFAKTPDLFRLLGDRLRWNLLSALISSDITVQQLARKVRKSQNLVSYHLKKLRRAGLISEQRSIADRRQIYYSANLTNLQRIYFSAGEALHPALGGSNAHTSPQPFQRLIPPVRVLFLCTHNSARSQMAEGILRAQGGDLVDVYSAGNQPGQIHPLAIKAMQTLNINIAGQKSKSIEQFLKQKFDFVITVCDRAKESCPIFPGDPNQIHWSFPDPSEVTGSEEKRSRAFETIAQELNRRNGYLLMMIKRSIQTE